MKAKIDWAKHSNFVGEWNGAGLSITIASNGQASVKRNRRFLTYSFNGPIRKITNQSITMGYPFLGFSLRFSRAPFFDNGEWKILLKNGKQLVKLNTETEIYPAHLEGFRQLVHSVISLIARSAGESDFTSFLHRTSKAFQESVTPEKFISQLYSLFREKGVELHECRAESIRFTKLPSLDKDCCLVIAGTYTQSLLLKFELKYVFEFPEWKLFGLNLSINSST